MIIIQEFWTMDTIVKMIVKFFQIAPHPNHDLASPIPSTQWIFCVYKIRVTLLALIDDTRCFKYYKYINRYSGRAIS